MGARKNLSEGGHNEINHQKIHLKKFIPCKLQNVLKLYEIKHQKVH